MVLTYVTYGGLRGTAWANTFQTLVFMILGAVTLFYILHQLGGMRSALERVAAARPDLMVRGDNVSPAKLLTYTLIPMSAGMFPHLFIHWLSARRMETFRFPIVAYPICLIIVWVPSVTLGVLGHIDFPDLEGAGGERGVDPDDPPPRSGAPGGAAGGGGVRGGDVVTRLPDSGAGHHVHPGHRASLRLPRPDERETADPRRPPVRDRDPDRHLPPLPGGRRQHLRLAVWSFTGFASLFPIVVAAVYWRRATKHGAIAAVLTVAALWIYFFTDGWQVPGYSVGGSGVMPVAVIFAASATILVVVSLFTRPPEPAVVARFFPDR